MEVFNTLVRDHPEAGRSQWLIGDVNFRLGNVPEALRAYRNAIGLLGGHYSLLTEVGRRLSGNGYDRAAELILRFAWEDRPDLGLAPGLLATIYNRQERWREAEEAARASIAADSTLGLQYHILSQSLEAQGRLDEAVEARLGAINHGEGGHWEQWGWLAELELARGDTVAARAARDSAEIRSVDEEELDRMESFFRNLGLSPAPVELSDTARDLQNTRLEGGGGP
jgi:predicted Zn-dependent protease